MRVLLLTLISISAFAAGNTKIKSFRKAKKQLFKIHGKRGRTVYCGCQYNKKKISHAECGYRYDKYKKRSRKLEWEHIVPAHAFGQSFIEWREGHPKCKKKKKLYKGRKCAAKVSQEFRLMEADLYNLFPAVGSINAVRSNFSMTEFTPKPDKSFGKCDVFIDNRKVEPPKDMKGDIARIYFYMNDAYPGRGIISRKNRKLFEKWNKLDPVSKEECERVKKVKAIQGNDNKFVKCKES